MIRIASNQVLASLLVFSILVGSGFVSARSIAHETQHAQHQKATHGTVLCSWMCAAGQVLEGIGTPALIERSPVASSDLSIFRFIPQVTSETTPSRGPPLFSTI